MGWTIEFELAGQHREMVVDDWEVRSGETLAGYVDGRRVLTLNQRVPWISYRTDDGDDGGPD